LYCDARSLRDSDELAALILLQGKGPESGGRANEQLELCRNAKNDIIHRYPVKNSCKVTPKENHSAAVP